MIEQLTSIAKSAAVEALHITVRPMGQDDVHVTISAEAGSVVDVSKMSDKQIAIRQALAKALVANGSIGEMDVFLMEELEKYAAGLVVAGQAATLTSNAAKHSADAKQAASGVKKPAKAPVTTQTVQPSNKPVQAAEPVAFDDDMFGDGSL